MDAVFYDRKHKCEVRLSQLMGTNVVTDVITVDGDDPKWMSRKDDWGVKRCQLGDIGYKSAECPDYCNWDRYLMETDLVFLRLEFGEDGE